MSFDIFVQCFGETAKSGLRRERVRSLFPIVEDESGLEHWVVRYDALNSSDIYLASDDESLKCLKVSRPAGNRQLWEALLTVLEMGQVVMFWPGSPPLVAREINASDLPEGMREALGEPVFISQPEQFFEALKTT